MKLLHHRMPLWVWNVHILSGTCHQPPRSAEKFNNGDFLSTICSVCAYCVLLTIPMDYHLHRSRAMRGLATLSVPSMPNTTHETERKGQMTRCTKTFQGLPCAVQVNTSSFFFQASPPVCFPQWEASKQTSLWMCTRLKRAEVLKETEGWRAQNAGERANKTPLLLP